MEIERIKLVNPQPGDVVVIETKERLSSDSRKRIGDIVQEAFPNNFVLILDGTMRMVVRKESMVGVREESWFRKFWFRFNHAPEGFK